MKYYRKMFTNEIVYEIDAENYVLNELGITITPKGEDEKMTEKQLENIKETVDWFFSDNWIEEEMEEK